MRSFWDRRNRRQAPSQVMIYQRKVGASDTFNRANDTSSIGAPPERMALGATGWTLPTGNIGIISNSAYPRTNATTCLAVTETGLSDFHARVVFNTAGTFSNETQRFVFRYSDTNNYWLVQQGNATQLLLGYFSGGAFQSKASSSYALTAPLTLDIYVRGANIAVLDGGVVKLTHTDTADFNAQKTICGFALYGASVTSYSSRCDDWWVKPLGLSTPQLGMY